MPSTLEMLGAERLGIWSLINLTALHEFPRVPGAAGPCGSLLGLPRKVKKNAGREVSKGISCCTLEGMCRNSDSLLSTMESDGRT